MSPGDGSRARRIEEILPPQTALAYPALRELRPHLEAEQEFVRRVDELQRPEGYRLVGAFESDGAAAAAAGFRTGHNLPWGYYLYVDDLSTLAAARRRGHGGALVDWLLEEARRLGCDQLHLDSNVGPHRSDAHTLYLRHGLEISAHHFSWPRRG